LRTLLVAVGAIPTSEVPFRLPVTLFRLTKTVLTKTEQTATTLVDDDRGQPTDGESIDDGEERPF
jgi:hypothetical protein